MNPREAGFLLLTSHLGEAERHSLTIAQLRELAKRIPLLDISDRDRELLPRDLMAIGYDCFMAERICRLLEDTQQLHWYVQRGQKAGCESITRVSETYPGILRRRLGLEAPGCLWAKGDVSLLRRPAVALVGSRELSELNKEFARQVGICAAQQGYILISGNAKGADRTAQDSCLKAGGSVISIVADSLEQREKKPNVLWLSEDGFDQPFSAIRALSRNRIIHSLGMLTFVAQSGMETGGTWDGTVNNLRRGWSPVFCFEDGSQAVRALTDRGAWGVSLEDLNDFSALQPTPDSLLP